jgi:hypothetical protein
MGRRRWALRLLLMYAKASGRSDERRCIEMR